jgi:dynein heavy chain
MDSITNKKSNNIDYNKEKKDDAWYQNYETWFIFASIWSLGATVNEAGRRKMDNLFRDIKPIFSHEGTIYDYYIS